ncbi:MAG: CYTH domain-containing protein [Ruminococcus sp.]|nr:CYTH domain-containing protein [Ruminococcus sp.]
MSEPLEIEHKWLIEYPDISQLEKMDNFECSEIEQIYIEHTEHGVKGRIRKRGKNGNFKYYKTFKKKVSNLTRIEYESEISEEEYNRLAKTKRTGYNIISKTRYVFNFQNFTYEVDRFPFWSDRAFMECEVESEDVAVPIPDCVRVIKEVTDDKRYKNSYLARKITTEELNL